MTEGRIRTFYSSSPEPGDNSQFCRLHKVSSQVVLQPSLAVILTLG